MSTETATLNGQSVEQAEKLIQSAIQQGTLGKSTFENLLGSGAHLWETDAEFELFLERLREIRHEKLANANVSGDEPTIDEYLAQLRELEAQYPAPTWAEVMPEWKWLHEGMANMTFDPEYKYGGLCVAIYNKQVVGTDTNWLRLRLNLARELGIHPERLVITSFEAA